MHRRLLLAGWITLILCACRVSQVPPAFTQTFVPTSSLPDTATPTRTPTSTPVILALRVMDKLVNCRFGPGTMYVLVNELRAGQSARVMGRNDTSTWLYIRDPGNPDGFCWVSAKVTAVDGDMNDLPVVQPPPAAVTALSLRVEPNRIVVSCSQFPQTFFFEARVTANGPALVNWQWEASTGVTSDIRTLVFEEAGTKVINEYYQVGGPNEYWVKLHILNPGSMTEQTTFRASCTP